LDGIQEITFPCRIGSKKNCQARELNAYLIK